MMVDRVTVRRVRVQDAPRLATLSTQLGYPTTEIRVQPRLAQIEQLSDHVIYVADSGQLVVGWIHVCVRPLLLADQVAEIEGLVVDEALRGRGIGHRLVQRGERWAREKGCHAVYVRSNAVRERAHAFYLGMGYEHVKTSLTFRKFLRECDGA